MKSRKQDFTSDKQKQGAPRYHSGGAMPADAQKPGAISTERNAASSSRGAAKSRPEQDDALSSRGGA